MVYVVGDLGEPSLLGLPVGLTLLIVRISYQNRWLCSDCPTSGVHDCEGLNASAGRLCVRT